MPRKGSQAPCAPSTNAADLLNFRLPQRPKPQPQQQQQQYVAPRRQQHGNATRKKQQTSAYVKPKRKTGLFPLHGSPDHAFVITRQAYHGGGDHASGQQQHQQQQQYSFRGSDNVVSWESVRIVKYLTTTTLTEQECPICLGQFQCARITKCGHCFCLTCLIHHVQSAGDLSYHAPKCPCCAIPVHLTDTRAVQLVPIATTTTTASHTTPPPPSVVVRRFVKLHRAKACPAPYLPRFDQPRRGAAHAAPTVYDDADAPYCRFNYVQVDAYRDLLQSNLQELQIIEGGSMMMDLCRGLAIQIIQDEIAKAMTEAPAEQALAEQFKKPVSGVAMEQPSYLMAKTTTTTSTMDGSDGVDRHQHDHQKQQLSCRARGDSIVSIGGESHCTVSTAASHTMNANHKYGGSMYLDESQDYVFYQAEDGSLCFLSGFNMTCLQTEFAVGPNHHLATTAAIIMDQSAEERQSSAGPIKAPLPDFIEGRIIETERVQLTQQLRDRRRFLSHLPLFTEITFVEIGMGHLLSHETKKMFKKEFQQRKVKRAAKTQAEQRADAKLKRQEEERVNERKARYQGIDPTDDFFRPAVAVEEPAVNFAEADFGPILGMNPIDGQAPRSPQTPSLPFSFSQVIRSGEFFPCLSAANTEANFPSLGAANFPSLGAAALPTTQTTLGWSGKAAKKVMAPPVVVQTAPAALPKMTPLVSSHKKDTKPQKVVLLSTSHRGGF